MSPPTLTVRGGVVVSLLLLEIVLAMLAVHFSPPGTKIAPFWPIAGVSVVAMSVALPAWRPRVLAGIYVVTTLGNHLGGRELDVSLVLGVVNTVEAWVAMAVLLRGGRLRPVLATLEDLGRFVLAVLVAATLTALMASTVVTVMSGADFLLTVRTLLASHTAALLLIAPLGMEMPRLRGPRAGLWESLAQWSLLIGASAVIFSPGQNIALTALLFPLLAWGGVRHSPQETSVQLLVYSVLVSVLTIAGYGPFYAAVEAGGYPPEMTGTLLQAGLLAAAMVTLPLSLMSAQQSLMVDRLSRSHELVSNIIGSTTGTAILGTTNDGLVEFFNVGAETLTGFSADEVVGRASVGLRTLEDGRSMLAIIDPSSSSPATLAPLVSSLPDRLIGAVTVDWDFLRRDGEVRTVSLALSRRYGDDGEPIGYLGVAEDVTERRRHEAAVERALETERHITERLAQVDQTKNDFLASVSHELRTPVTSIVGYSQLLLSDDSNALPAMHRQIVGRIERNGRRLVGLIEDILTMSRVEVGDLRLALSPIDLRLPAIRAFDDARAAASERGLMLEKDLPFREVTVLGDAEKLERVFGNLLSNALKFSSPGDRVTLTMRIEDGRAVVAVSDSGMGIGPEDLAHLFDRFYRGSDARARAIQGAGLGLAIAHSIVTGHQGAIEVSSELGQGSTFVVHLPVLQDLPSTPDPSPSVSLRCDPGGLIPDRPAEPRRAPSARSDRRA